MTRKEFVAICVEHNVQYEIDPRYSISISAPKGKVFGDVHYADYNFMDESMSEAYQEVVDSYIQHIQDCDDPECWCHNEPDRPPVVQEVPRPKTPSPSIHPEVIEEKVVWTETGVRNGKEYSHAQRYIFNDGGREAAGFMGSTGDCVTRAIAIVTGKPYKEVYNEINQIAESERTGKRKKKKSNARTGVYKQTIRKYMKSLGYQWIPTMEIGQGCKVHLRSDELPAGRLVVSVSKHSTAMIDGVLNDTYDCSREGTRCVYGYYIKPE